MEKPTSNNSIHLPLPQTYAKVIPCLHSFSLLKSLNLWWTNCLHIRMKFWNVANRDNIPLFLTWQCARSMLGTSDIAGRRATWEKAEVGKKIYKNDSIGVWCENYVCWGFMYKKREKVAPVCCVNNCRSLKSIFSLGPVLSNVICSLALTSRHLFWTLNAITGHTGHPIPFSLAHNETLRHPSCFFLPSFHWN